MINKNIFMIWFGNNIPDFVNYSFETFKTVNNDFNSQLLFYNIEYINDIYHSNVDNLTGNDVLLYESIILAKNQILNGRIMPVLPRLSYFYRQKIINEYGGIYLDSDMFPIKKFDSKLLNLPCFILTRMKQDRNTELCSRIMVENGFFGKCKDKVDNIYPISREYIRSNYELLYPIIDEGNEWCKLKNKFYKCELKFGEHFNDEKYCYVDHYSRWVWNPNKCRVDKTSIDVDIENIKHYDINFII